MLLLLLGFFFTVFKMLHICVMRGELRFRFGPFYHVILLCWERNPGCDRLSSEEVEILSLLLFLQL